MLYNLLKIIHIISATGLLTSMTYCIWLWHGIDSPTALKNTAPQIRHQTFTIIIGLAFVQLLTGFTIISLKHYSFNALWLNVSFTGFILFIGAWFGFIYSLLWSEQRDGETTALMTFERARQLQGILLALAGLILLVMIFFMANRLP